MSYSNIGDLSRKRHCLDPFCGTGTTNKVAYDLNRKSIGIDISEEYIALAKGRNKQLKFALNGHYE